MGERDRSRCAVAQQPEMDLHWFRDRRGSPVTTSEVVSSLEGLPEGVRKQRQGEILQRLRAASRGELAEPEDLKPVCRDPHLWELRWTWDRQPWRMYHAEPPDLPKYLILLRFHEKATSGDEAAIKRSQNAEMDVASRRYTEGRHWLWGLT